MLREQPSSCHSCSHCQDEGQVAHQRVCYYKELREDAQASRKVLETQDSFIIPISYMFEIVPLLIEIFQLNLDGQIPLSLASFLRVRKRALKLNC